MLQIRTFALLPQEKSEVALVPPYVFENFLGAQLHVVSKIAVPSKKASSRPVSILFYNVLVDVPVLVV